MASEELQQKYPSGKGFVAGRFEVFETQLRQGSEKVDTALPEHPLPKLPVGGAQKEGLR